MLIQDLQSEDWAARRTAAERIDSELERLDDAKQIKLARDALLNCRSDSKWEVRRAVAMGLRHTKLPGGRRIQAVLRKLASDVYPEVQAAAAESLRRRTPACGVWEPAPAGDNALLDFVSKRVTSIANKRSSHRRIYEVISECGEHYYRMLASDTTHQIRSRLQPVVRAIGKLRAHLEATGKTDEETARFLTQARFNAERLEKLLDDLQQYTRESRSMSGVDLVSLLKSALSEARHRAEAASLDLAGLQEHVVAPQRLLMEADERALREAFINLIVNAYYATAPAGELVVRVEQGSDSVRVLVQDTGCGMTNDQLEQCLRRYITTRAELGGSGLGLPIARRIVEDFHTGSLEIASEPDNGTTVRVELPLRQADS